MAKVVMGATCPACGEGFGTGERFCPTDGTRLFDVPRAISQRETEAVPTDPLLGTLLDGRYRIEEKLGEGGMGSVYRATHTLMEKRVAVKVLRAAYSSEPTAATRFRREARSASRLDHEHCIRVFDFGATADGLLYLVMEHLEGATLAEELHASGPLAPPRAVAIAASIAAALEHAHGLGIVHRDLKPDNIFLTTRGSVKVLDFGLAKVLEDERGGTLTQAGMVFGTPEYMSPEQAEGRPLDHRSDLYSLGVVLYHMLTGQLPFLAPSFIGILTKHLTEPPISPRTKRPDLSPDLADLVLRCLAKDPADRFPSAATLRQTLLSIEATRRVRPSLAMRATEDVPALNRAPVDRDAPWDTGRTDEPDRDAAGRTSRSARGAADRDAAWDTTGQTSRAARGAEDPERTWHQTSEHPIAAAKRRKWWPIALSLAALTALAIVGLAALSSNRRLSDPPANVPPSGAGPAHGPNPSAAPIAPPGPEPTATGTPATATTSTNPTTATASSTNPATGTDTSAGTATNTTAATTDTSSATGTNAGAATNPTAATPSSAAAAGKSADDHLRAAAAWRKKNNRIKELFELQQAVRLEPKNRAALTQLGDALIANGQKDAGCKTLLRAIDHAPAAKAYDKAGCGLIGGP